jgi:hypothetical protein
MGPFGNRARFGDLFCLLSVKLSTARKEALQIYARSFREPRCRKVRVGHKDKLDLGVGRNVTQPSSHADGHASVSAVFHVDITAPVQNLLEST